MAARPYFAWMAPSLKSEKLPFFCHRSTYKNIQRIQFANILIYGKVRKSPQAGPRRTKERFMSIKSAWTIFKRILNSFSRDRVMTLSAALAYYAMFSIAPLQVLAIGVAGLVFGDQAAQHQLAGQIQGFVGPKAARVIESMMAAQEKSGSLIATIVGIVLMFLGASGIFAQLKDSLNVIWGVEPKADRGIFGVLFDRLFALLLVLLIGVLLLASMLLTTAISAFYGALEQVVPVPRWRW